MNTLRRLERAMKRAASYDEWQEAARAHDRASGLDRWKMAEQSRRYDWAAIRSRLERLRGMREAGDNRGLLFNLHEGVHGNLGGMGRSTLYHKARFGTKQLIVDYVDEVVSALQYLADPRVDDIDFAEKLDFFRRADHCFGHSAFMMSGSGSLFYFHIGVVTALLKEGLLPRVLSGSSGGSFVGALIATHDIEEVCRLLQPESAVGASNRRFEGEGQRISSGTHRNTNAIYDYGRTSESVFYYVMEYLDGVRPDSEAVRLLPLEERERLIDLGAEAIIRMLYQDGFFHADLHPGNLLVLKGGVVGFLDCGMAGRVDVRPGR